MDLHVFAQSLAGTTDDAGALRAAAEDAYRTVSANGTGPSSTSCGKLKGVAATSEIK